MDPEWLASNIKNMLRKQNKFSKKFRINGFKDKDKLTTNSFTDCKKTPRLF